MQHVSPTRLNRDDIFSVIMFEAMTNHYAKSPVVSVESQWAERRLRGASRLERRPGCGHSSTAGSASSRRASLASARLSFTICYRYGLLKVTKDGELPIMPSEIVSQHSRPFLPEEIDERS